MRRAARLVLGVAVLLASAMPAPVASAAPPKATVLFRLDDPRLTEVSGIGAGIASPDVFYVHNDSGDSARFFALDRHTGAVRAEFHVPGATNVDWEDLAVATDARGVPSVWLADIGDNSATRKSVTVYRVDEPKVGTSGPAVRDTAAPEVWNLVYPNGPQNAESLAVAPHGRAYIVGKSPIGSSGVYEVPAKSDGGRTQPLKKIGGIQFHVVTTGSVQTYPSQLSATSAAFGGDGKIFFVRTYTYAYGWVVGSGDLAQAIRGRAIGYDLPEEPLGEAITVSGKDMVVASENVGTPVYAIRLGKQAPGSKPSPTTSTGQSAGARSLAATSPAPDPNKSSGSSSLWWRVLAVVVLVIGALVVVAVVRGRRERYRPLR